MSRTHGFGTLFDEACCEEEGAEGRGRVGGGGGGWGHGWCEMYIGLKGKRMRNVVKDDDEEEARKKGKEKKMSKWKECDFGLSRQRQGIHSFSLDDHPLVPGFCTTSSCPARFPIEPGPSPSPSLYLLSSPSAPLSHTGVDLPLLCALASLSSIASIDFPHLALPRSLLCLPPFCPFFSILAYSAT